MLEAVLAAEKRTVKDFTRRAQPADEFGDEGLVVQLKDLVRDEGNHAEATEGFLSD